MTGHSHHHGIEHVHGPSHGHGHSMHAPAADAPAMYDAAYAAAQPAPGGRVVAVDLEAREAEWEFVPGKAARAWTYNGWVPGPVLEGRVGDVLEVRLTNRLPEATTIHWHGLVLPNPMDGAADVTYSVAVNSAGFWSVDTASAKTASGAFPAGGLANGQYVIIATSRDAAGKLPSLSAAEHAYRADVYSSNRLFREAREHWQYVLDNYSTDAAVMPKTLFGIARSFMWEREYEKAVQYFDLLIKDYLNTKEGREGLAFKGASLVRLSKHNEAAKTYEQYTIMFPTGERIESSYLNIIDALREAKRYDDALEGWLIFSPGFANCDCDSAKVKAAEKSQTTLSMLNSGQSFIIALGALSVMLLAVRIRSR
mgnify:CR=1 FL=1